MANFPEDSRALELLRHAVELSRQKMRDGQGGPFGAVIARGDKIVAEGWNQVTSAHDPTAHAEVSAIRNACTKLDHFDLAGCIIYSSCEPCPMCLGAIYWARLDGIVYANTRDEAAAIGFDDAHFYDQLSLPLKEQTIASRHAPLPAARRVFEEWMTLEGKTPY